MKSADIQQARGFQLLTRDELIIRYVELWGQPPRVKKHSYLWKRCAWKLLERSHGGLSAKAKETLDELMAQIELTGSKTSQLSTAKGLISKPGSLPPGTIIKKLWHGRELRVEVKANGRFEFENEEFRSLSAIATFITGTKWNGRAFFGLKKKGAVN